MNALHRIALAGLLLPLFLAPGSATAPFPARKVMQQPSVEELLKGADQAFQEQKWVETIQLYEAVVAREDEHPQAWFRLGYCWHVLGRMDRAIPAHKRASEFAEVRPVALYNLGCAYALDGKPEPAFDALTEAHRAGFADVDKRVRDDSDLASLLEHPRFESWLRGLSQPAPGTGKGAGGTGGQTPTSPTGTGNEQKVAGTGRSGELDFWVGQWEVYDRSGRHVGSNRIQQELDGHLIEEVWQSTVGGHGRSMNFIDPAVGGWKQVWVDDQGGVLEMHGKYSEGAMRFRGRWTYADGRRAEHRTTLTPQAGGRVLQVIEHSRDGGESWFVTFDGLYVPAGQPGPGPRY